MEAHGKNPSLDDLWPCHGSSGSTDISKEYILRAVEAVNWERAKFVEQQKALNAQFVQAINAQAHTIVALQQAVRKLEEAQQRSESLRETPETFLKGVFNHD